MVNLCYGTFMQLMKDHLAHDVESNLLGKDIFEAITPASEHYKFIPQYLSLFWARKRNIPSDIITSSTTPDSKTQLLDYFSTFIVPDINPALVEDYYGKLENLIANDDSINPKKKNSLHKLSEGDKSKYLTEVLLYALTKQNKDEVTKLDKDTIPLLAQVDQTCPICHEPLIKTIKGKTIYFFTVTRIYPEFLDSSLKDEFDIIKPKPTEPDDIANKICLCDVCSLNYLHTPTTAMYSRLLQLKKLSVFEGAASSTLAKYELEEKIVDILNKLATTDPEGALIKDFRMKPLDPCNKIPRDNYLLVKTIKDDNEAYFWFIKDHISQLDANKSSFPIIASEIKTAFLKLESEGHDQNEIYEALIDWIMNKHLLSASYKDAAHIVVSYFVQSCEVFNEITE